jgi:hypothetical protein
MITLYKKSGDDFADEIHTALEDLIITFETKSLSGNSSKPTYIQDGDSIVKGEKEINQWLRKLEDELKWQRSLSGDGCYINPETGEAC